MAGPSEEALLTLAEQRLRAQIAMRADEEYVALLRVAGRMAASWRQSRASWNERRRAALRQFVLACRVATFDRSLAAETKGAPAAALECVPASTVGETGEMIAEFAALASELRELRSLLLQHAVWMEDTDAHLNALTFRRAADHLLAAATSLE